MIRLTHDMRERLASALTDGCPVIAASAGADGQPKIAFYGSAHVYSDDQLAIWVRDPDSSLLQRIRDNPKMAFVYRNQPAKVYWQFFGRALVCDDNDTRDRVFEGIHKIEQMLDQDRNGRAVVIDVDRVAGIGVDMRREAVQEPG